MQILGLFDLLLGLLLALCAIDSNHDYEVRARIETPEGRCFVLFVATLIILSGLALIK